MKSRSRDLKPEEAEPQGNRAVPSRRSPRAIVAGIYRQHPDLLRNAGSLFATTGVTSLLGAAYWVLAAKLFSQQDVGYGAAEVPAMTLVGTVGMLGLGTLLVGELPNCRRRAELVSAALIVCSMGSLLLAFGFVFIASRFSERFATMFGTLDQKGIFVVGAVLTGVSMTYDMATIGMMRGGIQLARNIAFTVVKLAVLPVFAFILHTQLGLGITYSWVAGIAISLTLVAPRMKFSGARFLARPDWYRLRSLGRTAMAHNWLNIATTVPPTVFPVLVAVLVSPSANAAFYVAFTLASFIYVIPHHLATVLFAMAASEPHAIAHRVRFAAKLSFVIGLPAIIALILAGHWILGIYGPGYARIATIPLWLLALGYIPSVPKQLYIAICRANGRVAYVATLLTVFAIIEVGAVAAGAVAGGLVGLSLTLLVALTAEGIVIAPPFLRATMGTSRRRPIAYSSPRGDSGTSTLNRVRHVLNAGQSPAPIKSPSEEQQKAGINALIALASTIAPTTPLPIIPLGYSARTRSQPKPPPSDFSFPGSPNRAPRMRTSDSRGESPPPSRPAPPNPPAARERRAHLDRY